MAEPAPDGHSGGLCPPLVGEGGQRPGEGRAIDHPLPYKGGEPEAELTGHLRTWRDTCEYCPHTPVVPYISGWAQLDRMGITAAHPPSPPNQANLTQTCPTSANLSIPNGWTSLTPLDKFGG